MAKELYDWVKLALDNKWLVIACFTGFSSMIANINQQFTIQDKEQEKNIAVHEVAKGFQAVMAEYEPKPITNKIVKKIYKTDCNSCKILMNNHLEEFH